MPARAENAADASSTTLSAVEVSGHYDNAVGTSDAALSVDVLNLFDRRYYDIAYAQDYRITPTSPLVPNGITVHPGQPREVRLTLRLML